MIKCKYDWSAAEQWQRCLWDGLWLCQELAAKSIDPDGIAVCNTNTRVLMYLCVKRETQSEFKKRRRICHIKLWNPNEHTFCYFDEICLNERRLINAASAHFVAAYKWRKQILSVPRGSAQASSLDQVHQLPQRVEQNFNNTACLQLTADTLRALKQNGTPDRVTKMFINMSSGQVEVPIVIYTSIQKKKKNNTCTIPRRTAWHANCNLSYYHTQL